MLHLSNIQARLQEFLETGLTVADLITYIMSFDFIFFQSLEVLFFIV